MRERERERERERKRERERVTGLARPNWTCDVHFGLPSGLIRLATLMR